MLEIFMKEFYACLQRLLIYVDIPDYCILCD